MNSLDDSRTLLPGGRGLVTRVNARQIAACKTCKRADSRVVVRVTTSIFSTPYRDGERYTSVENASPSHFSCGCQTSPPYVLVNGTLDLDVPCDARCTEAKGVRCLCSCGGDNHGIGHSLPPTANAA